MTARATAKGVGGKADATANAPGGSTAVTSRRGTPDPAVTPAKPPRRRRVVWASLGRRPVNHVTPHPPPPGPPPAVSVTVSPARAAETPPQAGRRGRARGRAGDRHARAAARRRGAHARRRGGRHHDRQRPAPGGGGARGGGGCTRSVAYGVVGRGSGPPPWPRQAGSRRGVPSRWWGGWKLVRERARAGKLNESSSCCGPRASVRNGWRAGEANQIGWVTGRARCHAVVIVW